MIFISGIDFKISIKSTAPLSSISFLLIIILFVPDLEKSDELDIKLDISRHGIEVSLSHLQE